MQDMNKVFMASGFLLCLSLIMSSFAIFNSAKQQIVTINKEKIVTQFAKDLNRRSLPAEKAKRLSKRFAKSLKLSIDSFAKDNKVVVVDSKSVLSSGVDVSSKIMEKIIVSMRGGK